uniref:Cystatin domain-containing protein n=1 Tax=Strongyloides stercoralis TaxID=6248 RepID=A0A0K0DZ88_STRER
MYSKFIGLFFLIAVFMAVSLFAGDHKWTPVYYRKAGLMYQLAEKAVKEYNNKKLKRRIGFEVCQVIRAAQKKAKNKRFRLTITVTKPICTKEAGNVCHTILKAEFIEKNKKKYNLDKVEVSERDRLIDYPSCHYPEIKLNDVIPK